MSKSSGIMKIDSPGNLGTGLANIDQDVIRKQILAAKQVTISISQIYLPYFELTETNLIFFFHILQKKQEEVKKSPVRNLASQVSYILYIPK